jgi:hypothetical protein
MPNHVHLIVVPFDERGLGLAIGEAHRRYTNFVNARGRWSGHLFQSRFASVAMDEAHLIAAARYVVMNPVRARLVAHPRDWPWSSARAHLTGENDGLVATRPLLERIGDFASLLAPDEDPLATGALRAAETTGRPAREQGFHRRLGAPPRSQARGHIGTDWFHNLLFFGIYKFRICCYFRTHKLWESVEDRTHAFHQPKETEHPGPVGPGHSAIAYAGHGALGAPA